MTMRPLATALILLSILISPLPARAASIKGEFRAVVTWVIDGDSIKYLKNGARQEGECRMLHYNAPEMTGKERTHGRRATKKLISLIKGREVLIWGVDRDRYGRLLCEVRLMDGTYINDVMRLFLRDYPKRDIYLHKEKGQKKRNNN